MTESKTQAQTAREDMLKLFSSGWISQCIYAVCKLGIADLISSTHWISVDSIAETCDVEKDRLYRILSALSSWGIFLENDDSTFMSNPAGDLLKSSHEFSLKNLSILYGESNYQTWGEITQALKTKKSGFQSKFGKELFDYLKSSPKEAECFHLAMAEKAKVPILSILENYNFASYKKIVDVGGGNGALLTAILHEHEEIQGVIFDLPQAQAKADKLIQNKNLADRCYFQAGDFFSEIPKSADCYLLKSILHDWCDDNSKKILTTCHKAMTCDLTQTYFTLS